VAYVAAGAVDLAVVLGVEVDDVDLAAAVVLDNLVLGVVRATADDPRLLACLVVLLHVGVSKVHFQVRVDSLEVSLGLNKAKRSTM
jgi:fructose-1,6-bisphosphatase/inositol monophosphatase family enzyme